MQIESFTHSTLFSKGIYVELETEPQPKATQNMETQNHVCDWVSMIVCVCVVSERELVSETDGVSACFVFSFSQLPKEWLVAGMSFHKQK